MPKSKLSSLPSVRRLPSYLHIIRQSQKEGFNSISGTVIATELELEPIQVRKDIALTGIMGKPRVGYPIPELIEAIESYLSWDTHRTAILIGAGNLGTALLGYQEFPNHGLDIVAAFDNDAKKIGTMIRSVEVYSLDQLEDIVPKLKPDIAIMTLPSEYAQDASDKLVKAGITGIWNFTNTKLKVPSSVSVQKEDLSSGYAVLARRMLCRKESRGCHT